MFGALLNPDETNTLILRVIDTTSTGTNGSL